MQSVCIKEAGAKGPLAEETTLIGLTFGGYLRSKVVHDFDGATMISFFLEIMLHLLVVNDFLFFYLYFGMS